MKKRKNVRNPFYDDIHKNGVIIDIEPRSTNRSPAVGRPRRGKIRQHTAVRSVRLPVDLWKLVQAQARRERISINTAMRQAARIWIQS